jgi:hypothetical protein
MQKILHLRLSNPKDFDRAVEMQNILHCARSNVKSFAFAICVRAPTRTLKSPTAVLRD